jgi:hypothetical protein
MRGSAPRMFVAADTPQEPQCDFDSAQSEPLAHVIRISCRPD